MMAKRSADVEVCHINLDDQMDSVYVKGLDNKEKSDNDIDVEDSNVKSIDNEFKIKSQSQTQPIVVISPLKMSINESKIVDNSSQINLSEKVQTKDNNRLICGHCDRFFKSETRLETHINRYHSNQCITTFKCHKCDEVFVANKSLLNHLGRIHGIPSFSCNKCHYRARTKHNLNRHKVIHSIDRPFVCNYENCDKAFKWSYDMAIHQKRIHSAEPPFICNYDDCNKSFKLKKK